MMWRALVPALLAWAAPAMGERVAKAALVGPPALTPERVARFQLALERRRFSCGTIDGGSGSRTSKAVAAFQRREKLPVTGAWDAHILAYLGEDAGAFAAQELTAADFAKIRPTPPTWKGKAAAKACGYNTVAEMAAEKFHTTPAFLARLNPGVRFELLKPGARVVAPHLRGAQPPAPAARVEVSLGRRTLQVFDASGKVAAHFPCSIAADVAKRPTGRTRVKVVAEAPNYTFDPKLFAAAAAAEGIRGKLVIPPGPNCPVGSGWLGLALPGYGIHGTPDPEKISATQSHGCFRLANWNVRLLLRMAEIGTPVDVVP